MHWAFVATNSSNIENITSTTIPRYDGSVKVVLQGDVNGEQVGLGYMDAVVKNGYTYVDYYKIDEVFQGNGLSKHLFQAAIDEVGSNARIFEGKPGDINYRVLNQTGNINNTPWAKTLDQLGYDTVFDPITNTMTSTRRK